MHDKPSAEASQHIPLKEGSGSTHTLTLLFYDIMCAATGAETYPSESTYLSPQHPKLGKPQLRKHPNPFPIACAVSSAADLSTIHESFDTMAVPSPKPQKQSFAETIKHSSRKPETLRLRKLDPGAFKNP